MLEMVKSQLDDKLYYVLNKYDYVLTSSACRLIANYTGSYGK